ncbi:MAG: Phospholipase [Acidobacteriaceae bacterium]|nr:Phospholipase [Acidobacteriaceae bacterium]
MSFVIGSSFTAACNFASRILRRGSLSATLTLLTCSAISMSAQAQTCTPGNTNPSVTVCSPTPNAIVGTPTHVVATTTDSHSVTAVQIYVDNALVTQVNAASIDTYVTLSLGNHLVTVQGWDNTGATFKTNVSVAMTPPCALSSKNASITVCTPTGGAFVSSPVHLVAGITDSNPVQSIQVAVDRKVVYQTNAGSLDAYLTSVSPGKHSATITVKDSTGVAISKALTINVASNSGLANLRHSIFFVQENRSFDNYFGMLGRYRVSKGLPNSIDGLNLKVTLYDSAGIAVHPYHFKTVCHENLSPFWNESHTDVDGGKMDKFMQTVAKSVPSNIDTTGTRAMGYYDQTDLPYYYELATQFATSDRFFSPVLTNTNANRMYLFAATSFGHVYPDTPPQGGWTQPTIFDHMDQAGVSWRYYYQDNGAYLPQWSTYQRDASKLAPISSWYTDLQNEAALPSVIFIERAGPSGLDEHPGNNIQLGAADAAKIMNALLASPSWSSSALIFTYDEGGGLYDHVVPASEIAPDNILPILQAGDLPGDFAHSGFRIPMVVISPWVNPHYVSHVWRDSTSILRLIEDTFHVSPLTARDAAADNMSEFFNFTSPQLLTPPPLPAQPTNGVCDINQEKAPGR